MRKSLFLAALVAGLLVVQAPAVAQDADPLQWEHMPGQLFVKFQPNTDESVIAAINGVIGGQVALRFRLDQDLRVVKVGRDGNVTLPCDQMRETRVFGESRIPTTATVTSSVADTTV